MSKTELKPCPCCGVIPAQTPYEFETDEYGTKAIMGVVVCVNCGLRLETCVGQEEACRRWNRRTLEPETRKYAVLTVDAPASPPGQTYELHMPCPGQPGFYNQSRSLNAFFFSTHKRNVKPDGTLYICERWNEFVERRERHTKHGLNYEIMETFKCIWDFYNHIGYDYKTKKFVK